MAASGQEVKKAVDLGLEVGTQSTQSKGLLLRVMSHFPDGTIGVFEINYRTSILGPGHSYYAGELKILQSNPLKVLKTFAVDLTKEGYQGVLDILQMPWVTRPSVELVMVDNTVLIVLNEVNRSKQCFILDIKGNVLTTHFNNLCTTRTESIYFNHTHAVALNHSCFAVPVCYQEGNPQIKIYLFELKKGVLKKLKTLYLTRNHVDLVAESDIESKKQAQELPANEVTKIRHLERLTDEEFIIHGESGFRSRHVILRCNFVTNTVTKLVSPALDEVAVRVMNRQLLLCVGRKIGDDYVSQLYRIDNNKEAKEQKEAIWELKEAVDIRTFNGDMILDSVQCLPEKLGFLFRVEVNLPSQLMSSALPAGCFMHLFRKNTIKLLGAMSDIHSVSMTQSCIVYANKVVESGTIYIDQAKRAINDNSSFTHLREIPLSRLIREHKPDLLKEIRARFQTHYALSKFALFSQQVCNIVTDYADNIPSWTETLVPTEMYTLTPIDLFFAILNDKKYFSGDCADQMRALISKPDKSGGLLLQELKKVAEQFNAKRLVYLVFSRDTTSDQEKAVFRLLQQIKSFNDLTISPHFDELQEDWCRYRQAASCRMS